MELRRADDAVLGGRDVGDGSLDPVGVGEKVRYIPHKSPRAAGAPRACPGPS
jgi:hypothetical protein